MKRRRRKWRAPAISQAAARQVWRACFGADPWPTGWRVGWAGFMRGAAGLTVYGRREILLSYGDYARKDGVLSTLVHEFIHVRARGLKHGSEFSTLVDAACRRAGIPAVDAEHRQARIEYRRAMNSGVTFNTIESNAEIVGGIALLFGWSR